jgi:iron complex transport system substrate-binding protein
MRCSTAVSPPWHRPSEAEPFARYAKQTTIRGRIAKIPQERRPRVYYARGLETGLGGSIDVEIIEFSRCAQCRRRAQGGDPVAI